MQNLTKNRLLVLALGVLTACQNIDLPGPAIAKPPTVVIASNKAAIIVSEAAEKQVIEDTARVSDSIDPESKNHHNLWERMRDGFQLNQHYTHEVVEKQIAVYARQQHYFDLLHERASPFLFWIVEEIDRRGLPQEFALLPMVESSYNPNAYSREHAVGLWQFLGATGKSFGLQQDWWFDGRRDPLASTIAALDYMEELYQQFNEDWLLAIAGYNTGDGNLRRAIRRSGIPEQEANFWALNLASETKAHIPKLLALAAIISDNERWGVELHPLANQATLRAVNIGTQIDISQAATLAGIEREQLRSLNPGYLQWATHPEQPQHLLLPIENADALKEALTRLDKTELLAWDHYEIKPGDSLGAIAQRLNTRVELLQRFNSLPGSRIVAGQSLLIPRTKNPAWPASTRGSERNRARAQPQVPKRYTVRRADTMDQIARRLGVDLPDLLRWNDLHSGELIFPGQTLHLTAEQAGIN